MCGLRNFAYRFLGDSRKYRSTKRGFLETLMKLGKMGLSLDVPFFSLKVYILMCGLVILNAYI